MHIKGIFLAALLNIWSLSWAAQIPFSLTVPSSGRKILDEDFSKWLGNISEEWGIEGIGIAVVRKEGEAWNVETQGYGIKDRSGNPITENTLFSIASNSKLFTALSLGLLVSNSSIPLEWNTKVSTILPQEWKLQDKVAEANADLLDILSHRTGLPRHDLADFTGHTSKLVSSLRYLRPSAGFRSTWQYNNMMYNTASLLVERLSSVPYRQFVNDNIFTPLGMASSTYNVTVAKLSGNLAEGYAVEARNVTGGSGWEKTIYRPIPYFLPQESTEMNAGAGGVITSVHDIAIWLQTLLLEGRHPVTNASIIPSSAVLRAASGISVMQGRAAFPELSPQVYGAGQWAYSYAGHEMIEHSGSTPGFRSIITRFPQDELGIAVFINSADGGAPMEIIKYHIAEKVLNLPEIDWNSRWRSKVQIGREDTRKKYIPRRPNSPLPDVPLTHLAGIYSNNAYGSIKFCAVNHEVDSAPSPSCHSLASQIPRLLPGVYNSSIPTLIAHFPRLWATDVRLEHFSYNKFNVTAFSVFSPSESEDGNGYVIPTITDDDSVTAEFVTKKSEGGRDVQGIAFTNIWGAGDGVPSPQGKTPKQKAEVWFDRVYESG